MENFNQLPRKFKLSETEFCKKKLREGLNSEKKTVENFSQLPRTFKSSEKN